MSNYYNRQWRLPNAWNGTESNVNKQSNYSMDFDGTEYIDTNFVPADNLTLDFSVSAWINMAALSNNTDATVLGTYQFTNGRSRFFFRIYLTGGVYKYFFGLGPDSNYIQDSSVAISNFSVNTWVHLAVTYDGTNVKLYSNGTLDGTLSFSGTNNTYPPVGTGFDGNSYIGATNKTGTPSIQSEFTGKIDAVAIYNYALSLSQITTLYGSSSTGIGNPMSLSPKPVAYYPLGDQDAFNGAEYLTPNSSLKDYVFDLTGTQNTGQYVDISSYTGLSGVSAFTVSIWFQAHSFTLDYIFGISILPNWWENAIGLYAHSNELRANVAFANQSAGITNQSINLNEWYHAAITFDGSTGIATMYINKTAYAGTNNLGSTTPSFDTNLTIGAFPTGSTSDGKQYHFDGLLSNMTVFNAALPATGSNSIETLYNNGSPLTSMSGFTSLQGWWKLNSSEIYDSSNTQWQIANNVLSDKAYSFNGTNNIEITQNSSIQTSNFSIGLWIKGYPQLDKTIIENGGVNGFSIKTKHNDGTKVLINTGGVNGLELTGALNGEWNFVYFTMSGSISRGGLNGGYSNAGGAARNYDSSKGLFIGSKSDSTSGFTGEIAQVVYYDERGPNNAGSLYGNLPANPPPTGSAFSGSGTTNPNLVSWWKLDAASITDSQGSNNGTNNGATLIDTNVGRPAGIGGLSSGMTQANLVQSDLSFTSGYSPYAFDFDGATDYIEILPYGAGINLSDSWSVSIWINTTTSLSNKGILTSINQNQPYDFFSFGPKTKSNGKIETWLEGIGYTELTPVINDGNWHHLTFTYDHSSTTIKAYTDNSESYSSTSYDNGTGRVIQLIGAAYTSWYWIGKLSNLSVWNKQLTPSEVAEIYNEGVPSNLNNNSAYSNLVSWWQLGSNSSFNTKWTVLNEISTGSNGTSVGMMEDDIVDGVGSYANGLSSGMGGDEVIGDAPYSTANALSVNMDVLDRVTDTPS